MCSQDKNTEQVQDNDKIVSMPDELYHSFRNIFEMMKEAQRELHKVREEMKPVEN